MSADFFQGLEVDGASRHPHLLRLCRGAQAEVEVVVWLLGLVWCIVGRLASATSQSGVQSKRVCCVGQDHAHLPLAWVGGPSRGGATLLSRLVTGCMLVFGRGFVTGSFVNSM
jgi:hypothetical protein